MYKKLFYLIAVIMLISLASRLQAEPFSLGAVEDIELGNDTQVGPDASSNGSGLGTRDIAARRRVVLISYDISALKSRGQFSNVSFSHFSHDLHGETNVYGIIEDLDLLEVESLTWNTAPGVQNNPTPDLSEPVALDFADLTDVLLTFTGPGQTGVRFSTDTSEALADFLNSDTDGIVTFLFAPGAENNQLIIRSSEHAEGGSFLEGELSPTLEIALNPNPVDGAANVIRDVVLSWTPGQLADKHNVYIGTNFDDVNNAGSGSPQLVGPAEDANSYNAGRLEFDQTYYWRIDEVNAPPDTDWMELGGVPEFAQAPGVSDYAHDTTVDFSGAAAKYVKITANSHWGFLTQYGLSEVRFLYIPVHATEPSPDSEATDVDVDVVLGWRAGRETGKHDVYLSSDEQAVIDGTAPVNTVTEASYSTPLDVDSTYYWRVDEVNDVETPTTWQGEIWSFTTPDSLVVDDFELYNYLDPEDPDSNRIFNTWVDGFNNPQINGSTIGYMDTPFTEQSIVYSGNQSAPIFYDNSFKFSEADLPLSPAQNWTEHGVTTLVLYFHGDPSNTVEQMYVKVNGSKVVYDGDPLDIIKPKWKQWSIDLASFGVDLQNVTELSIGFGDEANIAAGGSGMVFIDEIVLAASAPAVPSEEVWVEAEANNSITAPMMIYNDPNASGGQYVSTETGTADEGTAPPYPNGTVSIPFTVEGGTYTARFRIGFPGSDDSCWVRIQDATITSPVNSSGWIHFNDIPTGDYWHWSQEVKSEDESGEPPVEFTLSAGTHNLEISYRGADLRIDAIVFSKID